MASRNPAVHHHALIYFEREPQGRRLANAAPFVLDFDASVRGMCFKSGFDSLHPDPQPLLNASVMYF